MEKASATQGVGACERRGRFWAVTDAAGRLVCLAVYRKGAREVLRRLALAGDDNAGKTGTTTIATTNISMTDVDTAEGQKRGESG